MKRILVIGCPGAGKSTFARALRDRTGLPLWYLDQIWHRPDRTTVSRAEFDARLTGLLRGDAWIIDGNYLRTLEPGCGQRIPSFCWTTPPGSVWKGRVPASVQSGRTCPGWRRSSIPSSASGSRISAGTSSRRSAACWSSMAKGGKCMFSTAGPKQMTGCGHSREYEKRRGNALSFLLRHLNDCAKKPVRQLPDGLFVIHGESYSSTYLAL